MHWDDRLCRSKWRSMHRACMTETAVAQSLNEKKPISMQLANMKLSNGHTATIDLHQNDKSCLPEATGSGYSGSSLDPGDQARMPKCFRPFLQYLHFTTSLYEAGCA
jgi:hypothetical protein